MDPQTVLVRFKVPAPRFYEFLTYKYDIGVYIVPRHIFQGQDWTTFKHFDPDQGLARHHRPLEGGVRVATAEGARPPRHVVGGEGRAGADAPRRAERLAPVGRRAEHRAGADDRPHRHRHVDAAQHDPDGHAQQPADRHPHRGPLPLRLHGLVALLPLPEHRAAALRRPGRPLGAQLLHRPASARPGRLRRRRRAVAPAHARLSGAPALHRLGRATS